MVAAQLLNLLAQLGDSLVQAGRVGASAIEPHTPTHLPSHLAVLALDRFAGADQLVSQR
jgi:hypothetical protein